WLQRDTAVRSCSAATRPPPTPGTSRARPTCSRPWRRGSPSCSAPTSSRPCWWRTPPGRSPPAGSSDSAQAEALLPATSAAAAQVALELGGDLVAADVLGHDLALR